ncbi:hypothetical protein DL93DRAFT_2228104 [Clavulina sp. PMI_390]|nr:hypothetical protein DL93DRAFT_2228104 [Clavulina sp. PMI_390]
MTENHESNFTGLTEDVYVFFRSPTRAAALFSTPKESPPMTHSHVDTGFKMAPLHNSLQPIINLPTEILAHILLLASSRGDDWYYPEVLEYMHFDEYRGLCGVLPSRSFASLNLLCKQMREIALASPHCWKDVLVVIQNNRVINPPRFLEDRLNRSRSVHLKLFFHHTYEEAFTSDEETTFATRDQVDNKQTLELLGPHVHRCQHVTLYNPRDDLSYKPIHTSRFLDSFLWSYPSLRQLTIINEICIKGESQYRFDWHYFWAHGDKPNLACVELSFYDDSGGIVTSGNLIAPPGVSRLRLNLGYGELDVLNFLRQAPQLEHFDWHSFTPQELYELEPADSGRFAPTMLPNLLSLRLRTGAPHPGTFGLIADKCEELYLHEVRELWYGGPNPYSWSHLTLPRLKRFSISRPVSDGSVGDDVFWGPVGEFLARHLNLEDVICYSPREQVSEDNHWRWPLIHVASSLQPKPQSLLSFNSNDTTTGPLPRLRTFWFEGSASFPARSHFQSEIVAHYWKERG